MTKSWALNALAILAALSTVRAACDDIDQYLNIPMPMTGDMEINLDDVGTIECEEFEYGTDVTGIEQISVSGGTLTLKSTNNVRFVNVGFKVMAGANLVFDMPKTKLGPNTEGFHRGSYSGVMVETEQGGSATFLGKVVAKELTNVSTIFQNAGSMEFKKMATFKDSGNVFHTHTGTLKFRGITTFANNVYLAIDNQDSGYVRFSKEVIFDDNASNFDGAWGCSVINFNAESTIIFAGDVIIRNNDCSEGVAVYNRGDMKFSGKAQFSGNTYNDNGGAVNNVGGTMRFKGAVQFIENVSADFGGGIAVEGGDVIFEKAVLFDGNSADSGAAYAATGGSLTFQKPSVVRFRNGITYDDQYSNDDNCIYGEVTDGATVVGFSGDDVCGPAE